MTHFETMRIGRIVCNHPVVPITAEIYVLPSISEDRRIGIQHVVGWILWMTTREQYFVSRHEWCTILAEVVVCDQGVAFRPEFVLKEADISEIG